MIPAQGFTAALPQAAATVVYRFGSFEWDPVTKRLFHGTEPIPLSPRWRSCAASSLAAARTAVRTLDVIVTNHLPRESDGRAVWTRSRRIAYPGKPRTDAAAPKAPEETPAAA